MEVRVIIINFFERWLKSIDLISITLIVLLMILGLLFVTTASPNVAKLKSLNEFYFIKKHYLFAFFSMMAMITFSLFSTRGLINISYLGLALSIISIVALSKSDIKGVKLVINVSSDFSLFSLIKIFLHFKSELI